MREMFSFRLVLVGPELDAQLLNRLWERGCDDAAIGEERGVKVADFDRSALTFEAAVLSAVRDIEEADVGLLTIRLEPDDLVTASEIAERTGRSRQNVAQLVAGLRRSGDFPPPLSTGVGKTRVWRWTDVQAWLARHDDTPSLDSRRAHFIAATNGMLDFRRHARGFQAGGGSPAFLESLQTLAHSASQSRPLSICEDQQASSVESRMLAAISESAWDWDTCRRSLREDVRRTQSHCVFLITGIVSELSQELTDRAPLIARWVTDAASAHSRSVEFRLAGDVYAARALDREVAANAGRILRNPLLAAPARHQKEMMVRVSTEPWSRDSLQSSNVNHHSVLDWLACETFLHETSLPPNDRAPHREQTLREVVDALYRYEINGLTDCSYRYSEDHASPFPGLAGVSKRARWHRVARDEGLRCPQDEWSIFVAFDEAAGTSCSLPVWVAEVEESRVLMFVSAWTLASTIGLLVQRYLPRHTPAVDDVISRIERDLASRSF